MPHAVPVPDQDFMLCNFPAAGQEIWGGIPVPERVFREVSLRHHSMFLLFGCDLNTGLYLEG